MRALLLLATSALWSGCLLEPGLDQSTTKCPASVPLERGFKLVVQDPGRLVGRCVEIKNADHDGSLALRHLGADGVAYLPVENSGRYSLAVSVRDVDDKYCVTQVVEFQDHPGQGVVEVQGEVGRVCS